LRGGREIRRIIIYTLKQCYWVKTEHKGGDQRAGEKGVLRKEAVKGGGLRTTGGGGKRC